jgi:adenosine kinase
MSDAKLVICGSIAIDRIMNFNGSYSGLIEPSKLETLSVSVLVDSLEVSRGGVAANISHSLAQLGETPLLMGSVGQDAADYIKYLSQQGISTEAVHISHLPTASFNVLTDTGGNQVGGFYPGAMSDASSLSFKSWAGNQEVIICISAHDPDAMRRQVQECADGNLRLFYDVGQQVSNIPATDLQAGIDAAEVLIVNDYELGVLLQKTGYNLEELQAKLPILITTHGENGSAISGHKVGDIISIGSAKPTEIADPTGAGDAYRAGFLYGFLRQWDVRKCGQLGAVVASFVLQKRGTQVALDRDAIAARYMKTFNEELVL